MSCCQQLLKILNSGVNEKVHNVTYAAIEASVRNDRGFLLALTRRLLTIAPEIPGQK